MSELKIPGPELSYCDLVDFLTDEKEEEFDAFPLRPSSAGKCSRALTYELLEWLGKGTFPKEKKAPNVKRLLSLGSSVEYHVIKQFDQLQKASRDFKIRYKQQVLTLFQIPGGPLIEGSTDLWIMNRDNNRGGILDVKSTKEKYSQSYKSDWEERIEKFNEMPSLKRIGEQGWYAEDLQAFLAEFDDDFKKDNFLQLNSYCCAPFSKEHGVDHGSIVYYSKNTSNYIEVRFKPSEALFEELKKKFINVWEQAKTASVESLRDVLCDYPPGSLKAAFCPCVTYSGRSQTLAMKEWFATFPKKSWPTDAHKLSLENELAAYELLLASEDEKERIEQEIAKHLLDKKISKVRLENGHVYELKQYKTGGVANGPRIALKRSKA